MTIEQKEVILNDVARQMGEITRKLNAISRGNKNVKEAMANILLASDWLSDEVSDMIQTARREREAELEKFFNAMFQSLSFEKGIE